MKDKLGLLGVLILNVISSFFIIKLSSDVLFLLFIDFILWFGLYFLYEFIVIGKIKFCNHLIKDYLLYYLLNLFILIVGWLYLEFNFLKIKFLIIIFIVSLSLIKKKLNSINLNSIIPYLLLINIVLVFGAVSPMSPVGNKNSGTDSSVFRYIGTIMTEGSVPYLDVFDHKGIFLYFINYLGVLLDKNIGIWIIEMIFLYISVLFSYKLAKLFTNKFCSLVSVVWSFIPLIYTFEGGNLVEEYALPFIVISLYLFTRDIKKYNYIKLSSAFYIGVCFGAVLLLRPNMIAVWICMVIYLLILYLKNRKYIDLFKLIGTFLLGIVIFIVPFLIYLIYNEAISDFVYQYFIINFMYSTNENGNTLYDTFLVFIDGCKYVYLVIIVYLLGMKKYRDDKFLMIFYLGTVIVSFLLVILPKNFYLHYGMVMIPTFVVAFSIIVDWMYHDGLKFIKNIGLEIVFILLLICSFIYKDILIVDKLINDVTSVDDSFNDVLDVINSNSNDDDNILFFGNKVLVYLRTNRRTELKYPYQTITRINDDLKEDFYEEIEKNIPVLIITNDTYEEWLLEFLKTIGYNYTEIYDDFGYSVYELKK